MKNRYLRLCSTALLIALGSGLFSGCGNDSSNNSSGNNGSITVAGSTALQPLAEIGARKYEFLNAEALINVQGGGSGTGLTQVLQGAVQIGNSDIFAEEKLKSDQAAQLVDHKICVISFGVVANSKVKIDNLKSSDLVKIFTGEITNWKDVGGEDLPITVINRPRSSGTRAAFKKYALGGKDEVEGKSLTEDSSGAVKKTIEASEGAIGYLGSSFLYNKANLGNMKILKLDGIEMNKESVTTGKYPIWSYEHMYTKGEPVGLTKAYLDFMVSDEVKSIVEKQGYIPISDMKVNR